MKKLLGILTLAMVLFTGCFSLYTIDPDGNESKVELSLDDSNDPGVTVDPEQKDVDVEKQDTSQVTDPKVDAEGSDQVSETQTVDKEDNLADNSEDNPTDTNSIDDVFVTQFTNDQPYDLEVDVNDLSSESKSWSFKRNTTHDPVTGYYDIDISLFDAYFINTKAADEKVVYLTFDEGYENGYTASILDTLAEYNVKATFFITGYYIKSQPDLVLRMFNEGHAVANHSVNHKKSSELSDEELYDEITGLNTKYKDLTGEDLAPFFRPPSGDYSERSLYLTRKLGYRTIFWSMAFQDYLVDDQPGKEGSYNHVMTNYHNGAIILLHAVSQSNSEALPDILRDLKKEGYRFGSLYELE